MQNQFCLPFSVVKQVGARHYRNYITQHKQLSHCSTSKVASLADSHALLSISLQCNAQTLLITGIERGKEQPHSDNCNQQQKFNPCTLLADNIFLMSQQSQKIFLLTGWKQPEYRFLGTLNLLFCF